MHGSCLIKYPIFSQTKELMVVFCSNIGLKKDDHKHLSMLELPLQHVNYLLFTFAQMPRQKNIKFLIEHVLRRLLIAHHNLVQSTYIIKKLVP